MEQLKFTDAVRTAHNSVDERTLALQSKSTAIVGVGQGDPKADIERERRGASFNVDEVKLLLAGSQETLDLRKRVVEAMKRDPTFSKEGKHSWDREHLYKRTLTAQFAIPKLVASLGLSGKEALAAGMIAREFIDEVGGLELHLGMFIPTIQGQGDAEQQKHWLPLCYATRVIGTYAQTELGHGTFIRGLETTATYDAQTEEFIIHSPTLTSTKWWPGGLGKTCNHAVVMARLIINGQDKGIHPFIVQLRDHATYRPLPGITVGDIGSKMGYNGIDNGFLRFDHVRIPRRNMLMKHSKVDKDGTYHPPAVAKASYGTMVFVRSDIVMNASLYLKKAVTIAVRYNAVRRQSNPSGSDRKEMPVLDYQHSLRNLLPLVATAYAFHFTSGAMRRLYYQFEAASRRTGDFSALPELHATSSGLKALCSWTTKDAIETCRLACGGHGFMNASGLPGTLGTYAPNATYEGENNVLCLQTARYLRKAAVAAAKGQTPAGGCAYLQRKGKPLRSGLGESHDPRSLEALLEAHRHRAARLVIEATAAAEALPPNQDTFLVHMCAWIKAAKAHCLVAVLENFAAGLEEAAPKLQPPARAVLARLAALLMLSEIEAALGDFMEDGYLSAPQAKMLRVTTMQLLAELRPDAVPLVDAYGLDDYFLNSSLGVYDGDVYTRLFEAALGSPFNNSHLAPGFDEILKPKVSKGFGVSKL